MHPEDRSCWSFFTQVQLSLRPPVECSPTWPAKNDPNRWVFDWLDVVLRRRPEQEHAAIVISDELKNEEYELTIEEARTLSEVLAQLADLAESG